MAKLLNDCGPELDNFTVRLHSILTMDLVFFHVGARDAPPPLISHRSLTTAREGMTEVCTFSRTCSSVCARFPYFRYA